MVEDIHMKKELMFAFLSLLIVALSTSALGLTAPTSLTVGGTSQERGANTTAVVTITNTETGPVNLTLAFVGVDSTFNPKMDKTTILDLAPNTPTQVQLSFSVPYSLDAVDATGKAVAQAIGSLSITGKNATGDTIAPATVNLNMQAKNMLIIDNVVVTIDSEEKNLADGEEFKDVKPMQRVCVAIEVESQFTDDDVDPDLINVKGYIKSKDSGKLKLSDSDTFSDLSPDDTDSISLDCEDIEDDATGTIEVDAYVTGETDVKNGNAGGALMGEKVTFKIKIEREKHDVQIEAVTLSATRVNPTTKSIDVTVKLYNRGEKDEEDAGFTITSPDLDLNQQLFGIELDESDITTKTLTLQLPSNMKTGTYPVTIRSSFSATSGETDSQTVDLVVAPLATKDSTVTPTPTPTPQPTPQPAPVQPAQPTTPDTAKDTGILGSSNSALYVGGLVAGIVVIAVLIIVLLAVALRK